MCTVNPHSCVFLCALIVLTGALTVYSYAVVARILFPHSSPTYQKVVRTSRELAHVDGTPAPCAEFLSFRTHTHTQSRDGASPHLIRVYAHPTPVAAEIILRHTFFFFRADRSAALRRAWQSSTGQRTSVPALPSVQQDPHSQFPADTTTFSTAPPAPPSLPHRRIIVTHATLALRGEQSPGGNGSAAVLWRVTESLLSSETGNTGHDGKWSLFSLPFFSLHHPFLPSSFVLLPQISA